MFLSQRRKPTLFMFSGQGSQYYRMGGDLYRDDPIFRRQIDALDLVIRAQAGFSIRDEIFSPDKTVSTPLNDPLRSSLGIFLVERALAQSLYAHGIEADGMIGSSLGMLAAAASAGCMTDEEAVRIIIATWQVFEEHCPHGLMIAVLDKTSLYYQDATLSRLADLSGVNFSGNFVLSAPATAGEIIESLLRARGVIYQRLAVRYPYHSRWTEPIRDRFLAALAGADLRPPRRPLYCCSQVRPLSAFTPMDFWLAVRNPMYHADTIQMIERSGASQYVDLSPSGIMATFVKFVVSPQSGSTHTTILNQFQSGALGRLEALRRDHAAVHAY